MSTTSQGPSSYRAKKESLLTPTMLLVGLIPIFTFALGTWQVQRLQWKREPMYLPNHINVAAVPDFAYRKVRVKGRWDYSHLMLLGPRVRDGSVGYHVVVPFVRSNGSTVLVDRGFVSKELADNMRNLSDESEVEILGMLRTSHDRNRFTPDNKPEKGEWYWVDVGAMADYAGGEKAGVQPVFIEEIFEGHAGDASLRAAHGIPVGRLPIVDVRNAHASYIITWYSLSAFTSIMFVRLLMKRRASARLPR
ncbi:SURF1-domain-containing protein [Amylocystis lapponica]|nr:SURF1-domain-containing protein [Amylocystis lapponica]